MASRRLTISSLLCADDQNTDQPQPPPAPLPEPPHAPVLSGPGIPPPDDYREPQYPLPYPHHGGRARSRTNSGHMRDSHSTVPLSLQPVHFRRHTPSPPADNVGMYARPRTEHGVYRDNALVHPDILASGSRPSVLLGGLERPYPSSHHHLQTAPRPSSSSRRSSDPTRQEYRLPDGPSYFSPSAPTRNVHSDTFVGPSYPPPPPHPQTQSPSYQAAPQLRTPRHPSHSPVLGLRPSTYSPPGNHRVMTQPSPFNLPGPGYSPHPPSHSQSPLTSTSSPPSSQDARASHFRSASFSQPEAPLSTPRSSMASLPNLLSADPSRSPVAGLGLRASPGGMGGLGGLEALVQAATEERRRLSGEHPPPAVAREATRRASQSPVLNRIPPPLHPPAHSPVLQKSPVLPSPRFDTRVNSLAVIPLRTSHDGEPPSKRRRRTGSFSAGHPLAPVTPASPQKHARPSTPVAPVAPATPVPPVSPPSPLVPSVQPSPSSSTSVARLPAPKRTSISQLLSPEPPRRSPPRSILDATSQPQIILQPVAITPLPSVPEPVLVVEVEKPAQTVERVEPAVEEREKTAEGDANGEHGPKNIEIVDQAAAEKMRHPSPIRHVDTEGSSLVDHPVSREEVPSVVDLEPAQMEEQSPSRSPSAHHPEEPSIPIVTSEIVVDAPMRERSVGPETSEQSPPAAEPEAQARTATPVDEEGMLPEPTVDQGPVSPVAEQEPEVLPAVVDPDQSPPVAAQEPESSQDEPGELQEPLSQMASHIEDTTPELAMITEPTTDVDSHVSPHTEDTHKSPVATPDSPPARSPRDSSPGPEEQLGSPVVEMVVDAPTPPTAEVIEEQAPMVAVGDEDAVDVSTPSMSVDVEAQAEGPDDEDVMVSGNEPEATHDQDPDEWLMEHIADASPAHASRRSSVAPEEPPQTPYLSEASPPPHTIDEHAKRRPPSARPESRKVPSPSRSPTPTALLEQELDDISPADDVVLKTAPSPRSDADTDFALELEFAASTTPDNRDVSMTSELELDDELLSLVDDKPRHTHSHAHHAPVSKSSQPLASAKHEKSAVVKESSGTRTTSEVTSGPSVRASSVVSASLPSEQVVMPPPIAPPGQSSKSATPHITTAQDEATEKEDAANTSSSMRDSVPPKVNSKVFPLPLPY